MGLFSKTSPGYVKLSDSTNDGSELYGLSSDTKPTNSLKVGTSFFEIDTTDVYMWDGTTWRLI